MQPKRRSRAFDFELYLGLCATFFLGFILGPFGVEECSNDVPHYGLESTDHGLRAAPAALVVSPPPRVGRVQSLVDDRAGLRPVALVPVDPHGVVPEVRVATEPFGISVGVVSVGLVAPEDNFRAGPASPALDLSGEGKLHSASPSSVYLWSLAGWKEPLPSSRQLRDPAGDRAAEGRPVPDRRAGLYMILGVLVVSLGLLAGARVIRRLVGRLMDLWGVEC